MSKKKSTASAKLVEKQSIGIASPSFGVLSVVGSIAEKLTDALRLQGALVHGLDNPTTTGYSESPMVEDCALTAAISLHGVTRWSDIQQRPLFGIVTEPSDTFDGSCVQHFRRAAEVLCPSEWTRAAVARCAPVPATILRLGVDADAFPFKKRQRS